jgi:hypothetical protein
MGRTRVILIVLVTISFIFGLTWSARNFLETSTKFDSVHNVAFKSEPTCAKNSDFKKVKKGMSRKKVKKIMHWKGKLTHYELFKDRHGVWRFKEVYQYRRCDYLLSEKSYKVVFIEDPNLTEHGVITTTARHKYKLPV